MTGATGAKPRLVFVSPIFLFPADAGGKIRTSNILRGLKGGRFHVTLASPATPAQAARFSADIAGVCDEFVSWNAGPKPGWLRAFDLLRAIPYNVAADISRAGRRTVEALARSGCDLMVFDFVHAAVLRPAVLECASLCFTHNVEAEILGRHAGQAGNPLMRRIWRDQFGKMTRFESSELMRFDTVVAVSERDARFFRDSYALARVRTIPTGVDLEYFSWQAPVPVGAERPPTVVFTGSMNSAANIDGVAFFIESVWPRILERRPDARFAVVGRDPPPTLLALGRGARGVEFTGMVDDVRPYTRNAHVAVIPLRVGGGTRIKAFESMAMGCPVVSTAIGIEGLDIAPGVHYVLKDRPEEFADAVVELLADEGRRLALSRSARDVVEARFGHREAARVFEAICLETREAATESRREGVIR